MKKTINIDLFFLFPPFFLSSNWNLTLPVFFLTLLSLQMINHQFHLLSCFFPQNEHIGQNFLGSFIASFLHILQEKKRFLIMWTFVADHFLVSCYDFRLHQFSLLHSKKLSKFLCWKILESVHTRRIEACLFSFQSHWIHPVWTSESGLAFSSNRLIWKQELIMNQNQNSALLLTRGAKKFSPSPQDILFIKDLKISGRANCCFKTSHVEHLKLWPLSWISLNPQAGWAFFFLTAFPSEWRLWIVKEQWSSPFRSIMECFQDERRLRSITGSILKSSKHCATIKNAKYP